MQHLLEEGIKISEKSLYVLVRKYTQSGLTVDLKHKSWPSILQQEHNTFINNAMLENDKFTN